MEPAEAYYACAACGRSYRSTSTPDKCAVCGADSRAPQPEKNAAAMTDKFKLAAERAKGNF
jgi:hypothetical protein